MEDNDDVIIDLGDTPNQSQVEFEGGDRKENNRYINAGSPQSETKPESINLEIIDSE
jgi:hypothetical protein